MSEEGIPCEFCKAIVPFDEYESHVMCHQLEQDQEVEDVGVKCDVCGKNVKFSEYAAHGKEHEDEYQAEQKAKAEQQKKAAEDYQKKLLYPNYTPGVIVESKSFSFADHTSFSTQTIPEFPIEMASITSILQQFFPVNYSPSSTSPPAKASTVGSYGSSGPYGGNTVYSAKGGYGGARVNQDLSAFQQFTDNRERKTFERCFYIRKIIDIISALEKKIQDETGEDDSILTAFCQQISSSKSLLVFLIDIFNEDWISSVERINDGLVAVVDFFNYLAIHSQLHAFLFHLPSGTPSSSGPQQGSPSTPLPQPPLFVKLTTQHNVLSNFLKLQSKIVGSSASSESPTPTSTTSPATATSAYPTPTNPFSSFSSFFSPGTTPSTPPKPTISAEAFVKMQTDLATAFVKMYDLVNAAYSQYFKIATPGSSTSSPSSFTSTSTSTSTCNSTSTNTPKAKYSSSDEEDDVTTSMPFAFSSVSSKFTSSPSSSPSAKVKSKPTATSSPSSPSAGTSAAAGKTKASTAKPSAAVVVAAAAAVVGPMVDAAVYTDTLRPLQFVTLDNSDGSKAKEFETSNVFYSTLQQSQTMRPNMGKIMSQFNILSQGLPLSVSSSVFVITSSLQVRLLKAMIIGPKDTPYANGCFEFDLHLPPSFPNVAPQVKIITTGNGAVRFNPNLYNDGKVCLSLLGTWQGSAGESWNPKVSTILQVFVSLQALVFVDEPYFNEPGYEPTMGTPEGKAKSKAYNDNIRLQNLTWAILNQLERAKTHRSPFDAAILAHLRLKKHEIIATTRQWASESPSVSSSIVQRIEREIGGLT